MEKHLILPTKKEVMDTHLCTMAKCIILTVQTKGTTVKIKTRIGLPKKIKLEVVIKQQVLDCILILAGLVLKINKK